MLQSHCSQPDHCYQSQTNLIPKAHLFDSSTPFFPCLYPPSLEGINGASGSVERGVRAYCEYIETDDNSKLGGWADAQEQALQEGISQAEFNRATHEAALRQLLKPL